MEKQYHPSAIQPMTVESILNYSKNLNLNISSSEAREYKDIIDSLFPGFSKIYLMEEPRLYNSYPRVQKSNIINPLNAYSIQCDLKSSELGVLSGKTIAVKDTVFIGGLPLSNGSHLLEGFTPDEDATIILRILNSGIKILGKTRCEDLCLSANNFTCFNGKAINPIDSSITTGGSSSGSAALVSGGFVDIAIACDQGGSIRIPAACCGIIGFKPTFGLIPYTGILGIEYTFDHVGPIAKNTENIARFMDATAGPDLMDQRYYTYLANSDFSIDNVDNKDKKTDWEFKERIYYGVKKINVDFLKAWENYETLLSKNLKIGVLSNVLEKMESKSSYYNIINSLKEKHLKVNFEYFMDKNFEIYGDLFFLIISLGLNECEFSNDNSLTNSFNRYNTLLSKFTHASKQINMKDISHTNKIIAIYSEYIKEKYGGKFYVKASNIRNQLTKEFLNLIEKYDFIMMPTFTEKIPKLAQQNINIGEYYSQAFTNCNVTSIFNLFGLPAITINLSNGGEVNLDHSFMIVGKYFEDHRVIQIARYFEINKLSFNY